MDNIYDRQQSISLKIPETVSIVGLGGTGFWTAVFLAMSGVQNLILVDSDNVEATNLNRLPLSSQEVGFSKVWATKQYILNIRSDCRVEMHEMKIETEEDCTFLRGVICCCTDTLESQQLLCAYAKKNNLIYQRIGYDGTIINVSRAFPLTFQAIQQNGYTIDPSWVVPAALAAAAGVASILYSEISLMDDIGKLCIKESRFVPKKCLEKAKEEAEDEILSNITEYIPEDYGYCLDCSRQDCEDCDRGDCEECDNLAPEIVEEREEAAYNKGKEEGYEEGYDDGYEKGKDDGYKKEYDKGYENGLKAAQKEIKEEDDEE